MHHQSLGQGLGKLQFTRTSRGRLFPSVFSHSDLSTTMIYTHVVGTHERGVNSPLDAVGH